MDEIKLIEKIKQGDKDSFQHLFEKYSPLLKRYLYFLSYNEELSEDLLQETFLRAYEKIAQYKSKYKFSTWLFTIGRNLFYEYCRKNKKCLSFDEKILGKEEKRKMFQNHQYDEKLDLKVAIESLDDDLKKIIEMKYLFGFKIKDIAEILTIPEGTVKSKLFYAREKIKKFLKGSD